MRSTLLGTVCLALGLIFCGAAHAEGKKKKGDGDHTLDGQMAFEKKVMGEDSTKAAEMKKIAAAQKLAEEARKNPPPEPAPKVKDPNKEGVRAKQEATIGLAIPEEEPQHTKKATAKKTEPKAASTDDALGKLVAASLAEDKPEKAAPAHSNAASNTKGRKGKSRKTKGGGESSSGPTGLDSLFAGATK